LPDSVTFHLTTTLPAGRATTADPFLVTSPVLPLPPRAIAPSTVRTLATPLTPRSTIQICWHKRDAVHSSSSCLVPFYIIFRLVPFPHPPPPPPPPFLTPFIAQQTHVHLWLLDGGGNFLFLTSCCPSLYVMLAPWPLPSSPVMTIYHSGGPSFLFYQDHLPLCLPCSPSVFYGLSFPLPMPVPACPWIIPTYLLPAYLLHLSYLPMDHSGRHVPLSLSHTRFYLGLHPTCAYAMQLVYLLPLYTRPPSLYSPSPETHRFYLHLSLYHAMTTLLYTCAHSLLPGRCLPCYTCHGEPYRTAHTLNTFTFTCNCRVPSVL